MCRRCARVTENPCLPAECEAQLATAQRDARSLPQQAAFAGIFADRTCVFQNSISAVIPKRLRQHHVFMHFA